MGILPGLAKISTGTRRLKRAIDVLSGPLRRLFAGLAEAVVRIGRETRPSSVREAIRKLREELKRLTEGIRDATKRRADEAAEGAGRRADEGAEEAGTSASKKASAAPTKEGVPDDAQFAQKDFKEQFSTKEDARFPGLTIDDVAAKLRSGELTPDDVPIQTITRGDTVFILNTRSAEALKRAEIPRSKWRQFDVSGDQDAQRRLSNQLRRSGLSDSGTPESTSRGMRNTK